MRMPLPLGKARNNLYYLHNSNKQIRARVQRTKFGLNTENNNKLHYLKMWHIRLEHFPFNKVQVIFPELKGKNC